MLLIFYRDKTGKILRYHLPPKGMTPEQLTEEMAKFNERNDTQVYSKEIEEGSLEMHLFERAQYRRLYSQGIIQAALDAIAEARDCINCLEGDDPG